MTVKSAVSFIDEHHAFAKVMVERGEFASVSAVVAAGIQRLRDEEAERKAMLEAKSAAVRRLPMRSSWNTPREISRGSSETHSLDHLGRCRLDGNGRGACGAGTRVKPGHPNRRGV